MSRPERAYTLKSRAEAAATTAAVTALGALLIFGGKNSNNAKDSGNPELSVEPSVTFVGGAAPSYVSGKDKNGNFTFFAKKVVDKIKVSEDGQGGLVASEGAGAEVKLDLSFPLAGPHEKTPDTKPAASEPSIVYRLPSGDPLILQEDGHGGLVAENKAGELIDLDLQLPAPGPNEK